MRADICTAVTLDTFARIPYRDINCDTTLLICRCTGWCRTVYIIIKCRYRQGISFLRIYFRLNILCKCNCIGSSAFFDMRCSKSFISSIFPALRNFYFYNLLCSCIDRIIVHLYDLITFSSVSSLCCCFHKIDRLLLRNDGCQLEECRLKNCIDTSAKSDLFTNLDTVDRIEFDMALCNIGFYLSR